MSDNKQLKKSLLVDGTEYDINAVYADVAGQTKDNLKINKITKNKDSNDTIIFNGSAASEINVVPAEGGFYTGPIYTENTGITFKSTKDSNVTEETKYLIPNVSNIFSLVQTLMGCPFSTWNGSELVSNKDAKIGTVGFIFGNEDQLKTLQNTKLDNAPENYFYICSDTGNLYFIKGKDLIEIFCPTKKLVPAVSEDDKNKEPLTYEAILNKFDSLNTHVGVMAATATTTAEQNTATQVSEAIKTMTERLENGTIVVGKAKSAENASNATNATGSSNQSGSILYFEREIYNPGGYLKPKNSKIHISPWDPPSGEGNYGDIWIKCPEMEWRK